MSKKLQNQRRYARLIASTVKEHSEAVAQAVAARQATKPEHTITQDQVSTLMLALAGQIEERAAIYEDSLNLAIKETDEDSAALRKLEAAIEALRAKLTGAIALLKTSFEPSLLRAARLDSTLETTAQRDALIARATYAITHLKQNPTEHENAFGFKLSTQPIVSALEPLLHEAIAARDALTQDQRQTLLARQARDAAEADFWITLTQSASIIESFMRLSGHTLLANRLRPTIRRVRGEVDVEQEDDAEESVIEVLTP